MVHICEFTADLIRNNKLKLDPGRNDKYQVTFHDSCNTARGMGMMEEPLHHQQVKPANFHEMPETRSAADLLLRLRFGAEHRRADGDAHARRLPRQRAQDVVDKPAST
jgi:hypothetical protein